MDDFVVDIPVTSNEFVLLEQNVAIVTVDAAKIMKKKQLKECAQVPMHNYVSYYRIS